MWSSQSIGLYGGSRFLFFSHVCTVKFFVGFLLLHWCSKLTFSRLESFSFNISSVLVYVSSKKKKKSEFQGINSLVLIIVGSYNVAGLGGGLL